MWSYQFSRQSTFVIKRTVISLLAGILLPLFLSYSVGARDRERDDLNLLRFSFYLSPVSFSDELDKPTGSTLLFYNVSWEPEYMITNTLEWKVVELGVALDLERFEPETNLPAIFVLGPVGVTVGTGLTENFSLNRQFSAYMGPEISTTLYLSQFPGVTKNTASGEFIDKLTELNFNARDQAIETVEVPPYPRSGTFQEILLNPTNYKNIVGFPFLNTPLDLFATFGADYFPTEGNFSINTELNLGFRTWGYTIISPAEARMNYGSFFFRLGLGFVFDGIFFSGQT